METPENVSDNSDEKSPIDPILEDAQQIYDETIKFLDGEDEE